MVLLLLGSGLVLLDVDDVEELLVAVVVSVRMVVAVVLMVWMVVVVSVSVVLMIL